MIIKSRKKGIFLLILLIAFSLFFPINILRILFTSSTNHRLNIDYHMVTGPEWVIRKPSNELKIYFSTKNHKEFYVYLSGNEPNTYDKRKHIVLTNFILYGHFLDTTIGLDELRVPVFEVNEYKHLALFPVIEWIINIKR